MSFNVKYNFLANDRFSNVSKRIGKNISGLSTKFARLAVGAVSLTAAFGGLTKVAATGGKFQDALLDLSSITGITGNQLQELQAQAKDMSKEFITSGTDIVTAFKLVASANSELITIENGIQDVTKSILLLKNASGIGLEEATRAVTIGLNQFGASAKEANRFVNVLAAGSKIGASEISETGAALLKTGAVAESMGISFEELNGLIQVLSKSGIKAEIAGTQLKTAILSLGTAGIDKLNPKVVGITKALENLGAANLDTTQLEKLFGREAIVAGTILSKNVVLFKKWTAAITGTNIASEQSAIRLKSFNKRLELLRIVVGNKLIDIFFQLEDELNAATNAFINFVSNLKKEDLEGIVEVFKGMLSVLKALAGVMRFMAPLFKNKELTKSLAAATAGFTVAGPQGAVTAVGAEAFASSVGKVKGVLQQREEERKRAFGGIRRSTSQIDVNINAPAGVVQSVKSKSEGGSNLNVGQNLRFGNAGI